MTPITQSNTNGQYYLVDASLADFISMLFCNNSQRTDALFNERKDAVWRKNVPEYIFVYHFCTTNKRTIKVTIYAFTL